MQALSRRHFVKRSMAFATAISVFPPALFAQQNQVITVAGNGAAGFEENQRGGLPATSSPINNPYGIITGPDRALYFCEVDTGRIRRLDVGANRLRTIAGTGEKGYQAESRRAAETAFSAPHEIRFDEMANLYVVERDAHAVRRIAGNSGFVSTVTGNGKPGFNGDGGSSVLAQLRQPHSIAFDSRGNLLVCDIGNQRLRSVSRETSQINTIGGTGERIATPDEGPLQGTPLLGPRSLDTDPQGNAYLVLREGNAIYQLDIIGNRLQRIAGTGEKGSSGDGGDALAATFNGPKGIAYSGEDNCLYIVDTENHAIRRLSLSTGLIDTVLGNGQRGDGPDGDPLQCSLNRPHGVVVQNGIIYVTDSENHRIRALPIPVVSGLA